MNKFFSVFSLSFFLLILLIVTGCSDDTGSITVISKIPVSVVSLLPYDGDVSVPLTSDFIWITNYSGSVSAVYSVYLGTDKDKLIKIVDNLTDTKYSYSGLTDSTKYYWKVALSANNKEIADSDIKSFTTNYPPSEFTLLAPLDNATVYGDFITLKWNCSTDTKDDSINYMVYFGDNSNNLVKLGETDKLEYPVSNLLKGKTYYWRVVAVDSNGSKYESSVWQFNIDVISQKPILFSPINFQQDVSVLSELVWNGVESSEDNPIVYDVYLGVTEKPLKVATGLTTTHFKADRLFENAEYYWKVVARDSYGAINESALWSFTTYNEVKPAVSIEAGRYQTYYIDSDGNLWGFGRNKEGELADGTTDYQNKPILIDNPNYEKWDIIGAGKLHTCAIDESGFLYCWGWDMYGQLGIGYKTNYAQTSLHEVSNPYDNKWIDVDGGNTHTCAIDSTGTLYCWGENNHYQSGQSDNSTNYLTPVIVGTVGKVWTAVDVGYYFSCAKDDQDKLYCWGDNSHGQVPGSSATHYPTEISNSDNTRWSVFSAGYDHACGIDENGSLWCWGRNNYGQIGNGTGGDGTENYNVNASSPVKIINHNNSTLTWESVNTNGHETCAIDENNDMWCWGKGDNGTFGNGTMKDSNYPVKVINKSIDGWQLVANGIDHTCGVDTDNIVWCWGRNYDDHNKSGQLGIGLNRTFSVNTPILIKNKFSIPWKTVSTVDDTTCGIDINHQLYCWGDNYYGQLDNYDGILKNSYGFPLTSDSIYNVKKICVGFANICGIDENSELLCWGANNFGQLGNYTTDNSYYPVLITNGQNSRWESVGLGGYHTCGVDKDDDLWCWGGNDHGQLGDGTTVHSSYPLFITNSQNISWKSISLGVYHTCGIDKSDRLWCWGGNDYGQLGDGSNADSNYPVLITNGQNNTWKSISLGAYYTCGIDENGKLWCWGSNNNGQLGDGTTINSSYPLLITNSQNSKWESISVGYYHTCGIDENGKLWCWGKNNGGQLGNGTIVNSNYPLLIANSQNSLWKSVSLGSFHTCGIDDTNNLWCWGLNDDHMELGIGARFRIYPAKVFGY